MTKHMLGWGFALMIWEVVAQSYPDNILIAGPSDIIAYIQANTGLMRRAVLATSHTAAIGFFWGNLVAVGLAALVFLLPRLGGLIGALALLVFCLPLVATGPILRVLFGPGDGPQIILAALAVYYTSFLALLVGLRAVPQSWPDLIKIYGRGRMTDLINVRVMACLPYFIVGLQIGAPAAFLGAMIGEFTGAERGMGVLTLRAMRSLNVTGTWALASIAAAVAIFAYVTLGLIGQLLTVHRPEVLLTPPQHHVRRGWTLRLLSIPMLCAVVIGIWHISMEAFGLNPFFAKRPLDILTYLITGPEAATAQATLVTAMQETLATTVPGYFAGLILGAALAAALIIIPMLSRALMPVAIALRSVPIVTTAPLVVLALGRGPTGTITIVAIMIFFPTLVACLQGLRQTPGQIEDVFETYAASRFRLLVSARIPAMLPAFFASARMAVPAAILAVTTTEWLATGKGIGVLMALTATTSNYNMLWSCIVVLSLAAVAGYVLVAQVERAVLSRYAPEQLQ